MILLRFWSLQRERIPTAFSLMIPCALVLAAADIAKLTPEAKNRRRNEMWAVGVDGGLDESRIRKMFSVDVISEKSARALSIIMIRRIYD